MSQDHNHEADEHYHGEPSRVLEDEPYPETVVLYSGTPTSGFFSSVAEPTVDDLNYWVDQFKQLPNTSNLYTSVDISDQTESIRVHPTLEFGGEHAGSFLTDDLLSKPSILFVPARLRMKPSGWDDLEANDVTVNWLSLDPDYQTSDTPQAVVLSDWIVELGSDVPKARSAGTTPGIFHLLSDCFDDFVIGLNETTNSWTSINQLINQSNVKIRPGFIRDQDWHYA